MTAKELISLLGLKPLEREGGFFSETIRSPININAGEIRTGYNGERSLFTAIYYLLTDDDFSAPHKINSDEMWFFHFGDPIELTLMSPEGILEKRILGNDIQSGYRPQVHIPANSVQSAKLLAGEHKFALVSTVVIPGFDYRDFDAGKRFSST